MGDYTLQKGTMVDGTSVSLPVNGESRLNVLLKLSSQVVYGQICPQLTNEMAWLPNNLTHEFRYVLAGCVMGRPVMHPAAWLHNRATFVQLYRMLLNF